MGNDRGQTLVPVVVSSKKHSSSCASTLIANPEDEGIKVSANNEHSVAAFRNPIMV